MKENQELIFKAIATVIVILFYFIFMQEKSAEEINTEHCMKVFNMEIKGIVKKAYIDKNRKYLFVYVIQNQNDTIECINSTNYIANLETVLEKGDSMYKSPHSFINHIYKKSDKNKEIVIKGTSKYCGN